VVTGATYADYSPRAGCMKLSTIPLAAHREDAEHRRGHAGEQLHAGGAGCDFVGNEFMPGHAGGRTQHVQFADGIRAKDQARAEGDQGHGSQSGSRNAEHRENAEYHAGNADEEQHRKVTASELFDASRPCGREYDAGMLGQHGAALDQQGNAEHDHRGRNQDIRIDVCQSDDR